MENPTPNYQPPAQSSTLAIVSLIAGIAGWTIVPFLGSVVAVITGHMAKKEIRESAGRIGGESMATIGMVLGYAMIGFSLLGICIAIFALMLGVSLPFCFIPFANSGQFLAGIFGF